MEINSRKIIFLDVDGVLNNDYTEAITASGYTFVDDELISRLASIVNETDAQIVLSSDWRLDKNNSDLLELKKKLAEYDLSIIDYTPLINDGFDREIEVEDYLKNHPEIDRYVIFDDYHYFNNHMNNYVNVDGRFGLSAADVQKAIKILN